MVASRKSMQNLGSMMAWPSAEITAAFSEQGPNFLRLDVINVRFITIQLWLSLPFPWLSPGCDIAV